MVGAILAMARDIFDCHYLGVATGIWWTEARDFAKTPGAKDSPPQEKLFC